MLLSSGVFATALTCVATFETLAEPLRVNPAQPAPVTLRFPPMVSVERDSATRLHRFRYLTPMVARGEIVEDPRSAAFVRLYEGQRRPPHWASVAGLAGLYWLIAALLLAYLRSFSPARGSLLRTQLGVLGLLFVLLVAFKCLLLLTTVPGAVLPASLLGLWVARYLDRRTALIVGIATAFLTASLVAFRVVNLAVYLASASLAVAFLRNQKHSHRLFWAGVAGGVGGAVAMGAAQMLFEAPWVGEGAARPWGWGVAHVLVSGAVAGAIAYALRGAAETLLGAVSRSRLVELTDLDQPLLRKIAREAPGSWEHSRAMANLAEAAAASIGADALLTRVGAYYHDLGKSIQPRFFVENLRPGESSPHSELSPEVSADAIMAHVVEGTRILREGGIPENVVEFAYTHHGTTVIEFFWNKCVEEGNPQHLTRRQFRYPGMRPRTRETGILMIVDSVEAAARTISPPSREKFSEMVEQVVRGKLNQGQLDDSGLSLRDLRLLSSRLTDTLCSMYHARIRYPWQDAKDEPGTTGVAAGTGQAALAAGRPADKQSTTAATPDKLAVVASSRQNGLQRVQSDPEGNRPTSGSAEPVGFGHAVETHKGGV